MNTFGRRLRLHIIGESHGHGVGITMDGLPPGIPVDEAAIQTRLDARRPGTSQLVSSRAEADRIHIRSGVHQSRTTGAPVLLWIDNEDTRSKDYSQIEHTPRPGHSDHVAEVWSRGHFDPRGGGHYSGRLTAPLVAAAALIEPLLADEGIRVGAHVDQIHDVQGTGDPDVTAMRAVDHSVPSAHPERERMQAALESAREAKDSVGGVIAWRVEGVPIAWGDPFFDSVESQLAHMLFSIPAVKGVDFGAGFGAAGMMGSEHNDGYAVRDGAIVPTSNHAGGILGGRTTGAPLVGRVAIKPTSSIFQPQQTVDKATMEPATLELRGRHDPCIALRATPVVRAAVELVLADMLLLARQEGHAPSGGDA